MKLRLNSAGEILLTGAVISALLTRIFLLIRMQNYHENAVVADNLLSGFPHWRNFQSRLLGPLLQNGIERAMALAGLHHSPSIAYDLYVFVSLIGVIVTFRLIAMTLFRRPLQQLAYFLTILLSYICIQDRAWFYPWDPIDVIAFGLLYVLILSRRGIGLFWLLFVVAVFNKDTVVCIGLWLLIDSVAFRDGHVTNLRPTNMVLSLPKALSGAAMILVTFPLVEAIRRALYQYNYDLTGTGRIVRESSSTFIVVFANLEALLGSLFFGNFIFFGVFVALFLSVAVLLYRLKDFRLLPVDDLKIVLFAFALVMAYLIMCRIDEIRGVAYALPFILHAALLKHLPVDATEAASQAPCSHKPST